MASETKTTTDGDEIRRWVEDHGGTPASVKSTASDDDDAGVLRIDFPGGAGEDEQAHLIRDFRAFAGLTPTAYLERLRGRPQPFRPGIPFKTAPRSTP
jgi:hypothetical protein